MVKLVVLVALVPGAFNALAALAVADALGISRSVSLSALKHFSGVVGRMQVIAEKPFKVIVDFAHTPDSFEKLFTDIRPVVKGRLISVFGSAGRRDEAKRAIQGEIAGKYSDIVVLTEEDDRDIDGNQILSQIAEGATKSGKKQNKDLHLILNREDAIRFALKTAKPNDTVILLGKGHEKTIERADGEHPWDEIGLVKKVLKSL
jgi:UDP-N-acetylmuramoyl-L-alanyl-D-glutamate--2,6-diaminopimelate ligase